MEHFEIYKIINNNVVCAFDEKRQEIIITGKGIGFAKKNGQFIQLNSKTKVFRIQDEKALNKFKSLLTNLSLEHLQVSNDIILHAQNVLKANLNQNIYITLTDHINFAIQRFREGMKFQNVISNEVKVFYPVEYQIGKYALSLIKERIGVQLPSDEASSIAMHIINAEFSTHMKDINTITDLLPEIITVISTYLNIEFEEADLTWDWIISNLKFFIHQIFSNSSTPSTLPNEEAFCKFVEENYPLEYKCSQQIASLIRGKLNYQITNDNNTYLTICLVHLKKGKLV